ncbi:MAG: hypothetical protein JJD92_15420 [Frankiaceae bacterium]|nr:hypothetical protein [Frankiaceae bacterium]
MTRLISPGRRGDPVEVRRGELDGGLWGSDAPEQFLWRGRLYVVRAVLARWTESGGWWRGAAVRTLTQGDAADGPAAIDDRERDWWRVEADSGRLAAMSAGRGVYDLCFDWSRGDWSLARVLD